MPVLGFDRRDARLTLNLLGMSLRDRYLGSTLGLLWAVLNPLLLLGMYLFVFGFVFQVRLPGAQTSLAYAIWLISGFVPYLAIAESLSTTTNSVVGGANLVKNLVFKTELLPISAALVASVPFSVGLLFLLLLLAVEGTYPDWHLVALVPAVALQFSFLAALGLFLAATTVFLRDLSQVINTLTLAIVFFSPVFYTVEMLPGPVRAVTFLNPFYHMVQPYRDVLLQHQWPDWRGMLYLGLLSAVLLIAGLKYFRRLKGYFEMAL